MTTPNAEELRKELTDAAYQKGGFDWDDLATHVLSLLKKAELDGEIRGIEWGQMPENYYDDSRIAELQREREKI